MRFRVGNLVVWSSQAGGKKRVKIGKVEAIVPPNTSITRAKGWWQLEQRFKRLHKLKQSGLRDHESYLVSAGNTLYRPRVEYLRPFVRGG